MRNELISVAVILMFVLPSFAKTHNDDFEQPCSEVWAAVKTVVRHSGKYRVVSIDDTEMLASYNIGGWVAGNRINSVSLAEKNGGCLMETQTAYSGLVHNDAGDFKKRVEEELTKARNAKSTQTTAEPTKSK
jgi:hypothetical protein